MNKKGFTLIEIIISIALLGIISVVILYCIVSQYRLIINTRKMTQDLYESQQRIERIIEDVKEAVQSGTTPTGRTSYTLFAGKDYERTVYGFPRETEVSLGNNTRTLFTVIADNRMPEFAVASASISINFSNGSTIPYAYKDTLSLYVNSNVTLVDPNNVNLTNIYRWYVSRPGFNIPIINSPLEIEMGTKYPIFPDDYTIIPGVSSTNLTSILASYAGRHLVCTVTPAAQSGKMGVTAISKPVFISGLPVINNLILHLDASMISKEDSSAVNGEYVKKWYNISSQSNSNTANQTDTAKQPKLIEEKIGNFTYNGLEYETYAKFVRFDGSNYGMSGNISSLGGNNQTVFVVARNSGTQNFTIYQGGYAANVFSIKNNGNFYIGYDGGTSYSAVDVAEILVYNGILAQSDKDLINTYLKNKYQPAAPIVTIDSLVDQNVTVEKGSSYTLPTSVVANLSNGTNANVDVTWSQNNVNTNAIGVTKITGTAKVDTTKTMTLTVTVIQGTVITGPVASSITSGFKNKFSLYFDKGINISSATIDVDNVTITGSSGNKVTFTRNSNFSRNTTITINVTSTDGGMSTIKVRRNSTNWTIVSQG